MALTGLNKLITDLSAFNFEAELEVIVTDNKEAVVDLMRAQMSEGKDITGMARNDQYKEVTKIIKESFGVGLGAVTERVTFYMTGALYESLAATVRRRSFEIKSPLDTYYKMLGRVGVNNYGLSAEKRQIFADKYTLPSIRTSLLEKTGLKL